VSVVSPRRGGGSGEGERGGEDEKERRNKVKVKQEEEERRRQEERDQDHKNKEKERKKKKKKRKEEKRLRRRREAEEEAALRGGQPQPSSAPSSYSKLHKLSVGLSSGGVAVDGLLEPLSKVWLFRSFLPLFYHSIQVGIFTTFMTLQGNHNKGMCFAFIAATERNTSSSIHPITHPSTLYWLLS
jgi:hypothetical protein